MGRLAAGAPAIDALAARHGRRIFTGAALPPRRGYRLHAGGRARSARKGACSFLPACGRAPIPAHAAKTSHAAHAALPRGRRLRPQDLALAAALGVRSAAGAPPIRVALFSTGDEFVEPGAAGGPGTALRFQPRLAGRAGGAGRGAGARSRHLAGSAGGDRRCAGGGGTGSDLILTSGGVSAGDEDHVKAAVEAVGRLAFWRLAIKPGRPVAMGTVRGVPFVGLPGNPGRRRSSPSSMSARPLIAALAGRTGRGAATAAGAR